MLRRLEKSHDNVVGYSMAGEATDEEIRQTMSEMRDDISLHGKIRVLFRVSDISPKSFFTAMEERFKFAQEHGDDIERVAVVSDEPGSEWMTKLGGVLQPMEVRHFSRNEEQEAWAWLE